MDWDAFLAILVVAAIVGFLVLAYLVSNNSLRPLFLGPARVLVNSVSTIFGLVFGGFILYAMYEGADRDGWVPHTLRTNVTMSQNWLTGEFRDCSLKKFEKTAILDCDGDGSSNVHEMDVEFRGSLENFESGMESAWNCQRRVYSISCKSKEVLKK